MADIRELRGSPFSALISQLPEKGEDGFTKQKIFSHVKQETSKLTALLDVSGSGKTRHLYESLCQEFGVYMVGSSQGNGGSRDLSVWSTLLFDLILTSENLAVNSAHARVHFYVMVVFRLTVLAQVQKMFAGPDGALTPKEWLLMQAYPAPLLGGDIFSSLK